MVEKVHAENKLSAHLSAHPISPRPSSLPAHPIPPPRQGESEGQTGGRARLAYPGIRRPAMYNEQGPQLQNAMLRYISSSYFSTGDILKNMLEYSSNYTLIKVKDHAVSFLRILSKSEQISVHGGIYAVLLGFQVHPWKADQDFDRSKSLIYLFYYSKYQDVFCQYTIAYLLSTHRDQYIPAQPGIGRIYLRATV